MKNNRDGKKLVGLRIRLTPEEYDFAEFYGQEFNCGGARDYLRDLLMEALARDMREERLLKAQIEAMEKSGADSSRPAEGFTSPDFDDEIPF